MKQSLKVLCLMLALFLTAGLLAGCGASEEAASLGGDTPDGVITVGVIQFGSHPSLDNCYEGIEEALKAAYGNTVVIDRQDGNFDSATCDTIAKNMVAKNYDIIVPIATPAAISAYAAAQGTDIPVVFSAVSDPVAAGLVDSMEAPGGNCTGTSDVLDLEAQVTLIQTMQPDVKKIGVLYTTSEANSVSQLQMLKEIAAERGLEIVEQGVQTAADIPQAAASVTAKADCINNFTDNNVVGNLNTLLEQANTAGIPVYGSEEEQVVNGCLASISLDYVALGIKTGEMVIAILGGESAATLPVATITDGTAVVNTDVLEFFHLTLPEEYKDAKTVTTGQKE